MGQDKAIKVLVLGATGYVGSNIYKALKRVAGIQVTGTSRHREAYSSYEWYSPNWNFQDTIENDDAINRYDFDVIINCVGNTKPKNTLKHLFEEANQFKNIKKLFINWKRNKKPLYIHISSAAVYTGHNDYSQPMREEFASHFLSSDHGTYANRKKLAEQTIIGSDVSNYVILRPFTLIGTHTNKETKTFISVVEKIFKLERNPNIEINGQYFPTSDGTAVRDYVHIDKLVEFIKLRIETDKFFIKFEDEIRDKYKIVNIGTNQGTTNLQIVAKVARKHCNKVFRIKFNEADGSPYTLVANKTKYDACIDLMKGVINSDIISEC